MYHFGYGSNLKIDFLKKLLPSATFAMKGYLPNFEVQFRFWSKKRQGGLSNIMEAPGELVHGALFDVPEQELITLDSMEGVYVGKYKRMTYLILGEDGKCHPECNPAQNCNGKECGPDGCGGKCGQCAEGYFCSAGGTCDDEIPGEPDSPIVITEIMYDPSGIADDKWEWIELYNADNEAIDLNGWSLVDEKNQKHIIMNGGPFPVEPGEYLVLGCNSNESTNGGVELDYNYPYVDFGLANTGDSVILKNIYGDIVDAVHYDENTGWPPAKGASLSLLHPNLDNENSANWGVASEPYGDGSNMGTPGSGSW